ncbi:MAG: formate--phosphoribosylaminoimidazolecarboxamide ligase family protein [Candidatus Heimdallarchaeum endolithica]|uniref:Formate--phosphoribosylaminoimidazolecarboxamide ligase family protein n=1 Tax=Candidatus Heimdallarchaeum endolithica TaxID=2876572 RepID=A0A9Y1FQ41_9ARCH|nr:MAG: formate--phosphoribosylaminoimidazolecarboxamide ligase family protein [Candidatus Heimdallarchaeum endolithica]
MNSKKNEPPEEKDIVVKQTLTSGPLFSELLERYNKENITIGVIGSHSALDVLDGAKREGFRTLVVCEKGREEPYIRFKRIIDEIITLDHFSDIFNIQDDLINKNTIFIPNRSFTVYCGANRIERGFRVPIFGSRNLLGVEERVGPHNYYQILDQATIKYPRVYNSPDEIDGPVIVKMPHAKQRVERGFFIAKNKEDFEKEFEKRVIEGIIKIDDLKEASIEEFVSGVPFNFNFFYSPLFDRVELMGIDRRFVTDLDGIVRIPAEQQLKLGLKEEMKEIGNFAVTLRESMLRYVFPMGDYFVEATKKLYPPGIIGPFALQTMVTKDYEFKVFDVSMRMGGGTNSFMGIGSNYSSIYWGEPVSAGRRVAMEIKFAVKQQRLAYIVT